MMRLVAIITVVSLAACFEKGALGEVIGDSFGFVERGKAVATIVIGSRANTDDDLHWARILADSIRQILIDSTSWDPDLKKCLEE